MVLGALVIIVVGMLVINYFRDDNIGETIPDGITSEDQEDTLPTTHIVEAGETLWDISEKYYSTGYNWQDIANANNLGSADEIEEGQELVIPDVEPAESEEATPEPTITPSPSPTPLATATPEPEAEPSAEVTVDKINPGSTYIVQKGDTLWDISVRAYGTGYKWVDIARANNLANPNLIHPGNNFEIPAVEK